MPPIDGIFAASNTSPVQWKSCPTPTSSASRSSCDETAAAVVRSGEELISNVVYSQIATHQPYGGVVPELASREHLRAIVPVVRKALEDAGKTYDTIDAIAVTQGPGLAGALLVGLSYAKALAFAADKPLIAVNHLEGHIHAVLLEERQNGNHDLQFPGARSGRQRRPHPPVPRRAKRRRLDLSQHRPHSRRRRRRGLRQSRQAAGTRLSRRPGHRLPRAARQSPGGEVSLRADQAPRSQSQEPPLGRRTPHRLLLQRNQDRRAPLRGSPQHGREHPAPSRGDLGDRQADAAGLPRSLRSSDARPRRVVSARSR